MQLAATTTVLDSIIACLVATAITVGAGGAARVEVPTTRDVQVAVLPDGFAVMEGAANDRHAIAVNWDGQRVYRRAIPVVVPEARMAGSSQGIVVGWLEDKKVELARVTGDGELGARTTWGKRVAQMCDGVASNQQRWGIGWLENDGTVWVVHGPSSANTVASIASPEAAPAMRTVWCGVTSAGEKIALMWTDQHNRMALSVCDQKGCGAAKRVPLGKKETLSGIACLSTVCLIAARDQNGVAQLGWFTMLGKLLWWKPLSDATADSTFSVTAAGDRAFVVGYTSREGATATRVIESGSMVRAWADPHSSEAPSIAWANDRLLVAHRHGDGVAPEVVALPR